MDHVQRWWWQWVGSEASQEVSREGAHCSQSDVLQALYVLGGVYELNSCCCMLHEIKNGYN